MVTDYEQACDYKQLFSNNCDYCNQDLSIGLHCYGRTGEGANGCHEQFATRELLLIHIHKKTRGCKFPGNLPYFFERNGIWYKNHLAEERDRLRNTVDPFLSSSSTRSVERHSTLSV